MIALTWMLFALLALFWTAAAWMAAAVTGSGYVVRRA